MNIYSHHQLCSTKCDSERKWQNLGTLIKCTLTPKHVSVGDMLIMCCLSKFICACSPQLVVKWCLLNLHQKVPIVYRLDSPLFSNLTWMLKTFLIGFFAHVWRMYRHCLPGLGHSLGWSCKFKNVSTVLFNGLFLEENQTWTYFIDKITCFSVYRQMFSRFRSFGPLLNDIT